VVAGFACPAIAYTMARSAPLSSRSEMKLRLGAVAWRRANRRAGSMTTRATAPSSTSGKPIHSGRVLIRRDYLANVTSLEHEGWKRAHPEFCRPMDI